MYLSITEALIQGEKLLESAVVSDPRGEAEILLEKATNQDRVSLYTNSSKLVSQAESDLYSHDLERRCAGEPIQYITGKAPFYGREFHVGDGVFIPRLDSEVLIERLLSAHKNKRNQDEIEILDLCCGCGVLGLTAALELTGSRITLVDNSSVALECAARNANEQGIKSRVDIVCHDALKEFPSTWQHKFDYILANPPYISVSKMDNLDFEVLCEPRQALTDGGNGKLFYQAWSCRLKALLKPNAVFFCEIDCYISDYIYTLMSEFFDDVILSDDVSGAIRVCEAKAV